ncbi:DUF58 domain-containing protein [Streptomyces malaysiensis subsp. malaysiensis]
MTAPAPVPRPGAAVVRALEGRTSPVQPPPPPPGGPRPGERTLRLLTVAVVALSAALLTGRAWLFALAAAPLVLLALALPRAYAHRVETSTTVEPERCFEGDTVTLRVSVAHGGDAVRLDPGVTLGPGMRLDEVVVGSSSVMLRHTALHWGRWTLGPVDLDVYDAGGTVRRTVRVEAAEVSVFPYATQARFTPIPARLPQRLGEHASPQAGEGVEVIGVGPWVPGERQRRIHWPSTTRRGSVQLHRFAAERAADAVMLIDAFVDIVDPVTGGRLLTRRCGPPPDSPAPICAPMTGWGSSRPGAPHDGWHRAPGTRRSTALSRASSTSARTGGSRGPVLSGCRRPRCRRGHWCTCSPR